MVASGLEPGIEDPLSLQTTNWFDEISQHNAFISSTDISASGGGDKGGYFLSGSYFTQEGTIKKTNYDRVTMRANTTLDVKPWLTIGENLSLSRSRSKRIGEGDEWTSAIITSIAADPASPVRNPDGTFARSVYNDTWNPAAILAFTNNNFSSYRTLGNVFANIRLHKNFTIKSNYSGEYTFSQSSNYDPIYAVGPVQQNSVRTLTVGNSNLLISQWSNTLNYEQIFGEHHLTALVGVETYNYTTRFTTATANNLPSDDIDIRFLDNASGNNQASVRGSKYEEAQLSYLGRVNYNYNDKYLITANIRGDASSKFSKKNRWGYFPSFSAGWNISNENFMESLAALNQLKLRVGWGKIGNQGSVPAYQDVTTANTGSNYLWGGVLAPGSAFPGSGNDEIKWETSTTLNFGLDFRFFRGKLYGSIDYYNKETTDMLLQVPVPGQTGIQIPPTQNAGSMKNTGTELALNYKNYDSEFKYSVGLVFSKTDNEVVDLGSAGAFINGASFFNSYFVTRTTAGKPIAQFYGFKTNGLFQNQAEIDAQTAQNNVAPGDVRYVDANNDGELDFFYLGSPLPDFTYGFNTNFMYKGFDLTINIQGVQGNKIFNGTSQYKRSSTGVWNLGRDMVNRWIGEGTQNDARYPRMNFNDVNNSRMSDRFIEDGSYLRIKTVQLGYSVSEKSTKKIGIERLRLYGNVQNLFTFTNYSGVDPEIGMRSGNPLDIGVDRGLYPQPRTFTLGMNISF
jgi:TonB-linked SusC/RagA family outer membrane protein